MPRALYELSTEHAVGLGLLYASGFFVANAHVEALYFVSSLWNDLLVPSIACVAFVALAYRLLGAFLIRNATHALAPMLARIGLTFVIVIGLRGVLAASGLGGLESIANLLNSSNELSLGGLRARKTAILVAVVSLTYASLWRLNWPGGLERGVRLASALGYSLLFLALFNLSKMALPDWKKSVPPEPVASSILSSATSEEIHARRVIWIIFDELDYKLTLGDETEESANRLNNVQQIARNAVSAQKALSPSNATVTSIPSLLIGSQTTGEQRLGPANTQLIDLNGKPVAFSEVNTLFGRLRTRGMDFSIMGFHHPYCDIFLNAGQCYQGKFGTETWYRALIDWVPGLGFFGLDPISVLLEKQFSELPSMLNRRKDAVTFLHIAIPHLPSYYASKHYGQAPPADYLDQYRINLRLTDEILGRVIKQLVDVSADQNVLLIVSGDHGFRLKMRQPNEARPVPWIAWRVGAYDGQEIAATISTVHTAALIEDFLAGKITSQAEIARWWQDKPVLPRRLLADKPDVD